MTDITWEQAREKVRERWPNMYIGTDGSEWQVYDDPHDPVALGYVCSTQEGAVISAYNRMTASPLAPLLAEEFAKLPATSPSPESMTASQPVPESNSLLDPQECPDCEGVGEIQTIDSKVLPCPTCIYREIEAKKNRPISQPIASPERIAAVTELPPPRIWATVPNAGGTGMTSIIVVPVADYDAALADVRKFEDADASQAAEMAALRSAKEKAEKERDEAYKAEAMAGGRLGERYEEYAKTAKPLATFSGWLWNRIAKLEAAEAENTRLKSGAIALYEASDCRAESGPPCGSCLVCIAKSELRAALSTPATKKEG